MDVPPQKAQLFLYDVTSSYFEGHRNELAEFGYNRDGKKGKLQIVIGLLCNEDGEPISVEVFEGDTKDNKTLAEQIKKAALRFNAESVTLARDSLFDGCYALKTDLPQECANKETVHSTYKDLALVEQAFRSSKTIHLEMRPIYVRLASRTRGHVFVAMLAYRIIKELSRYWRQLDITVEEGISLLAGLCQIKVKDNGACYYQIPNPDNFTANLLSLADISLPKILPKENNNVTTTKKLPARRKNL